MAAAFQEAHSWKPRLRVLCLHGHTQTSATFEQKIARLLSKAASFAEFVFVDGPVELPLSYGERVNTLGWWPDTAEGSSVDDSAVQDALEKAWSELGPFDGVLGFSEGARAAHCFCRQAREAAKVQESLSCGAGLRFVIVAGAPGPRPEWAAEAPLEFPSLHLASPGDAVVPLRFSKAFAKCFANPKFHEHDGGHGVPQRVEDLKVIVDFLQAQLKQIHPGAPSCLAMDGSEIHDPRINEDQLAELEALQEFFQPDEVARIAPAWPVRVLFKIQRQDPSQEERFQDRGLLCFTLPPGYPEKATCRCQLQTDSVMLREHSEELLGAVDAEHAPLGFPSMLPMMQAAQQWIMDYDFSVTQKATDVGDGDAAQDKWWLQEELDVNQEIVAKADRRAAELLSKQEAGGMWAREAGAGGYGKPWNFVVGLVGKPSVGKSTFFNAATRPEEEGQEAPMAPHPFTTIDPNVSGGWFGAPGPAVPNKGLQPQHGKVADGRWRQPLVVKDVAGLVPGAYLGRGRGNAFLNDLCDADSLIHIVDASGRSDSEGVDQGAGNVASDPLDEIGWVRREIHLWIFTNVRSKWDTVRRKARLPSATLARDAVIDRLFNLFTGYRATQQMAIAVYEAAGFSLQNIAETILAWSEYELHLLVACFLRLRFPILVALNKVDMPGASERVVRVKEALGDKCVPVCAASEWWLWEQKRKGLLDYVEGGGPDSIRIGSSAGSVVHDRWGEIQERVFKKWGTTGVMQALSAAVLMRRPLIVYPVADFDTFQCLRPANSDATASASSEKAGGGARASAGANLATLVILRPQSTVDEAFAALKYKEMLRGDFVRAERYSENGGSIQKLRRTDTLQNGPAGEAITLKVLTNKMQK